MRIGLLTTSFPRHEGDVAGSFVLGFARALAARGHTVEVLAPEPLEPTAAPAWPGVRVRFVPYVRPRTLARTFYGAGVPDNVRDARAWPGLAAYPLALATSTLQRRARWDALVSHFALPSGLIAGALRGARPHLAVLHSADLHVLARLPAATRWARALLHGSSHVSCVSARAREQLLSLLPAAQAAEARARVHVQPMGVEPLALPPRDEARRALGVERPLLLTLARLVPVKGLREALHALRAREDVEWVIAGDGPERAHLETLAREARMRVRCVGHVAGEEKLRWLAAADALLLPSTQLASGRTEGMPTAVLEAMTAGLPVIASDVGGIGEVVEHGAHGWLFDPSSPSALHRAVSALVHEPALARSLGERGRERARAYQWSAIAPRIEGWLS